MAAYLASLCILVALTAVLLHCQLECEREREERLAQKFNSEYHPDQTDCQAQIQFFKTDSRLVSVSLGNWQELSFDLWEKHQSDIILLKNILRRSGVHIDAMDPLLFRENANLHRR